MAIDPHPSPAGARVDARPTGRPRQPRRVIPEPLVRVAPIRPWAASELVPPRPAGDRPAMDEDALIAAYGGLLGGPTVSREGNEE